METPSLQVRSSSSRAWFIVIHLLENEHGRSWELFLSITCLCLRLCLWSRTLRPNSPTLHSWQEEWNRFTVLPSFLNVREVVGFNKIQNDTSILSYSPLITLNFKLRAHPKLRSWPGGSTGWRLSAASVRTPNPGSAVQILLQATAYKCSYTARHDNHDIPKHKTQKIKMLPENWIFWIILHLNKLSIYKIYSLCISFGRRLKSLLRAMQWPLVFWPAMWRAALSPNRQCLPRILWCLMLGSPVNCGKPFEDQDVMSGLYVRWTNVILM